MAQSGLSTIARLTHALSRATSHAEVYDGALDALQEGLGVERASVLLFDAANVMSFVAWRGLSDSYRAAVNGHTPWRPDSRDVAPIVVPDVQADDSLAPYLPVFQAEDIRALGFFALVSGDCVIGKFMLYYREPHTFSAAELELAQTIAAQIAFGVARLRAESALKRERDRLAFLSRASVALSSSLDYQTTLEHVAQLAVRELADWCAIDVLDEDDVQRLAVVHRDPSRAEAARLMRTVSVSRQRTGTIRRVMDSGQPELVHSVAPQVFERLYADDHDVLTAFSGLGLCSYMSVPLVAAGQCLGALTLVSSDPKHLFEDSDLELAAELGRRAGSAIDNARLFGQAQAANRAKDEFLVTLSHELRTPMTATLGWAAMLRGHDLSPDNYRLAIDTIERSTRAQAKLIDDILDVSRIISGKLELSVAPLSVRSVVDLAIDAIRPSLAAKQLDLEVSLGDTQAVAIADASRLQQVLWNLLANAVKFTPAGGTVFVALQVERDAVRIVVRDTGIGIPRRFLPHVFERFHQADSSSSRTHGGLGLGLAIVKNIVEMHGGAVAVESEGENRGSTFTITLPLAAPSPVAAATTAEANAPQSLAGLSVLVVEDEADTRSMLSAALESSGAKVTAVASVAAAVAAIESVTPHVVISDIGMPEEDGYGLMLRIRANPDERIRTVPAIAVTAYVAPHDRTRVLASGFDYHLGKPLDPVVVVKTVKDAAGR